MHLALLLGWRGDRALLCIILGRLAIVLVLVVLGLVVLVVLMLVVRLVLVVLMMLVKVMVLKVMVVVVVHVREECGRKPHPDRWDRLERERLVETRNGAAERWSPLRHRAQGLQDHS